MYNEEQKKEFIKFYTGSLNTAKLAETLLTTCGKFEKEWGCDLCAQKNSDLLQEMVNKVVGARAKNRWVTLSILKEYVKWCIAMKVPDSNDLLLNIRIHELGKVRQQFVSSPMHLQRILNEVYEAEDSQTIGNVYRSYFWLAYLGFPQDDLLSMTCDCVDINRRIVKFHGVEKTMYKESVAALTSAALAQTFVYKHPGYETSWNRVEGNLLLRGIKTQPKPSTFRTAISETFGRAIKEGLTTSKLSYSRVRLSGMFYRLLEVERAGYNVVFDWRIPETHHLQTLLEDYDNIANSTVTLPTALKEDYLRWKAAFSL